MFSGGYIASGPGSQIIQRGAWKNIAKAKGAPKSIWEMKGEGGLHGGGDV